MFQASVQRQPCLKLRKALECGKIYWAHCQKNGSKRSQSVVLFIVSPRLEAFLMMKLAVNHEICCESAQLRFIVLWKNLKTWRKKSIRLMKRGNKLTESSVIKCLPLQMHTIWHNQFSDNKCYLAILSWGKTFGFRIFLRCKEQGT